MLIGILLIVSVGIVPAALAVLRLDGWTETLVSVLRWPLLLLLVWFSITVLYRYGPSRQDAKWRWLSWGATLATVVWVVASWGFSFYLQNFADYNATYGTLGAVIGFMIWTWISVVIVLVGAELNAEMEHQTAKDFDHRPAQAHGQPRRRDGRHRRQGGRRRCPRRRDAPEEAPQAGAEARRVRAARCARSLAFPIHPARCEFLRA